MKPDEAAKDILDYINAVYVPTHEYVHVSLGDIPGLGFAFYDCFKSELEQSGFTIIGDIEDKTITNAPGSALQRTVIRTMLSGDRTIMAAAYEVRFKLFWGLLSKLLGESVHQVVDFETEYEDGSFLVTSNAETAANMSLPPMVFGDYLKAKTPTLSVLDAHILRMRAYHEVSGGVSPKQIRNYAELIKSQDRLTALKAAYRNELGGVSLEELQRMSPKWSDVAQEFHRKCVEYRGGVTLKDFGNYIVEVGSIDGTSMSLEVLSNEASNLQDLQDLQDLKGILKGRKSQEDQKLLADLESKIGATKSGGIEGKTLNVILWSQVVVSIEENQSDLLYENLCNFATQIRSKAYLRMRQEQLPESQFIGMKFLKFLEKLLDKLLTSPPNYERINLGDLLGKNGGSMTSVTVFHPIKEGVTLLIEIDEYQFPSDIFDKMLAKIQPVKKGE